MGSNKKEKWLTSTVLQKPQENRHPRAPVRSLWLAFYKPLGLEIPARAKQDQYTPFRISGTYSCVLEKSPVLEVPRFARVSGLMGRDLLTAEGRKASSQSALWALAHTQSPPSFLERG